MHRTRRSSFYATGRRASSFGTGCWCGHGPHDYFQRRRPGAKRPFPRCPRPPPTRPQCIPAGVANPRRRDDHQAEESSVVGTCVCTTTSPKNVSATPLGAVPPSFAAATRRGDGPASVPGPHLRRRQRLASGGCAGGDGEVVVVPAPSEMPLADPVLVHGADIHPCPLSEYDVKLSEDGQSVVCWIPSTDDQPFSVRSVDHAPHPGILLSARVALDGRVCGRKCLTKAKDGSGVTMNVRDTISTSDYTRRALRFGKQAVTDDDAYLNATISPDFDVTCILTTQLACRLPTCACQLKLASTKTIFLTHYFNHTITVEIREVEHNATNKKMNYRRRNEAFEPKVLHEKSKKGLGHSVQLGEEIQSTYNRKSVHATIRQVATFTFRYRPIELLRAQGIAPPLPSATKDVALSDDDVIDLTLDDSDERVKREDVEPKARSILYSTLESDDILPDQEGKEEGSTGKRNY
uniref:DUF7918 domain-containing protein n=1 Tax=Mycena chlorophos TaxID=658473 RepID=A0ABQ0L7A5_MYCCL|nr:predicted protein [Mycena chlorophos]